MAINKLVGDGAGIRDGSGEAIEFRHDQRVALASGGEAGSDAGRAGEAVIGVDAILGDAQLQEGLALGVWGSWWSMEQRAYPMNVSVMGKVHG